MKALKFIGILWASPYTVLGLLLGLLAVCTGGRLALRWPLEFSGGFVTWFLNKVCGDFVLGMTLGHVIVGKSPVALDIVRDHELVHVRQYERWGLLFGPAYYLCWFVLWCRGQDGYRQNPFEKEAYGDD